MATASTTARRSLDALKYASVLAAAATVLACYLVVYELAAAPADSRAPVDDDDAAGATVDVDSSPWAVDTSVQWLGFPLGVWEAVPIINVAFTAHYNGPRFFQELSARSLSRFFRVVSLALTGALAVYLAVALSGYLVFGAGTSGDVLENFRASYPLAVASRGALLVILIAVYPKAQHSLRDGKITQCHIDARSYWTTGPRNGMNLKHY